MDNNSLILSIFYKKILHLDTYFIITVHSLPDFRRDIEDKKENFFFN